MDFFKIVEKKAANNTKTRDSGSIEIYPDFHICKTKDLMVRGRSFYAIWDAEQNAWLTDEMEVVRLVDKELFEYASKFKTNQKVNIRSMISYSTGSWNQWMKFIKSMPDNYKPIDNKILFANDNITKASYSTHHLNYNLEEGSISAYDKILSTLYEPEEREKLEWSVGAILTGDSKIIQKFCVLYGESGSGKSTFLNIVQMLVAGYYISFNAKALVGNNNIFATEVFKNNPLVAIQHDGDLSRIEDNSTLNSIISHEEIIINEKHKSQYSMPINCFLFMGTNKPVKITDTKSGIIRRLIDVRPSGVRIPPKEYDILMGQVEFELGAIAYHCIEVYQRLGIKYYNSYTPRNMMFQTNVLFNFIEENYFFFKAENEYFQLKQIYDMYKQFSQDTGNAFSLPRHVFREELKAYFENYSEQKRVGEKTYRSVYWDFKPEVIDGVVEGPKEVIDILEMKNTVSLFDKEYSSASAQYANDAGTPSLKWDNCKTTLENINTSKLHFVRLSENHIVIDFDLKNQKGEKDKQKNLEEASKWPKTYSEFSKSGAGIHLHYIYDGDPTELSRLYAEDIEIKVFSGNSSLRRQLTLCNDIPIAHISSGLPLKEKGGTKNMMNSKTIKTEKSLRDMILRNLNKEFHSGTKPSIDFIKKILDEAYESGMVYDVSDMRGKVLTFATNSSNQSEYCIKLVAQMKFTSIAESVPATNYTSDDFVFFDIEVFPNLFLVAYKIAGKEYKPNILINPTPRQIEEIFRFKLIGFNCRRYDNHMLYGCYLGYNNEQLYTLSTKLVGKINSGLFREAYNISYTDVYDFANKKQSLKKWEIELGLKHHELGYRWDQPVPKDKWEDVGEYCCNDVYATEEVFYNRKADWAARLILAELTGMTPNNTTNQLVSKLIFGNEKKPQLVYTDLSETFPGYEWKQLEDGKFHNMYRGEDVSLGGYVYAEPGIHEHVAVIDVASMHPASIINMNYFGEYTKNYQEIRDSRLAIKHGNVERVLEMFNGRLVKYLNDPSILEDLAYALKIALNSAYGLTSAKFENIMKHPKNVNNIVALRGALFMRTLQDEIKQRGFQVAHIKTDSIKIPNATPEIIQYCLDFAKQYGYDFEHEATYEKMCLVNDAVYIAKYEWAAKTKLIGTWVAVGAQFQHPYIFKKLFSREKLVLNDFFETKTVAGDSALYLDFNEQLVEDMHQYHFVGKAGEFCPVKDDVGGGILYREKDGKYYAATGTKGYRWLESEVIKTLDKQDDIDMTYFENLLDDAIAAISEYGDFKCFIDFQTMENKEELIGFDDTPPIPCSCGQVSCDKCGNFNECIIGLTT